MGHLEPCSADRRSRDAIQADAGSMQGAATIRFCRAAMDCDVVARREIAKVRTGLQILCDQAFLVRSLSIWDRLEEQGAYRWKSAYGWKGDFAPIVRQPRLTDSRIFRDELVSLSGGMLEIPFDLRFSYDDERNIALVTPSSK
ncbi:hypothetical protein ACVIGB_004318 [Bradyrhizobium sp. USDA 4341]